jgi:ribosomal protein S12 methylthiotransferase accessory factor
MDGLALRQGVEFDPLTKLPSCIRLELELPSSFPDKYRAAVLRAAEGCKVKKAIGASPSIEISLSQKEPPPAGPTP